MSCSYASLVATFSLDRSIMRPRTLSSNVPWLPTFVVDIGPHQALPEMNFATSLTRRALPISIMTWLVVLRCPLPLVMVSFLVVVQSLLLCLTLPLIIQFHAHLKILLYERSPVNQVGKVSYRECCDQGSFGLGRVKLLS